MMAGCTADERGQVEQVLKNALTEYEALGSWNISAVKAGESWSINIDGPEPRFKSIHVDASTEQLSQAVGQALQMATSAEASDAATEQASMPSPSLSAPASGRAAAPSTSGEERRRADCERCEKPFDVFYFPEAGEDEERAPVACPYCWKINHVSIGMAARFTGEYRAEKAE